MSPRRSRLLAAAVLLGQLLLLTSRSPDPGGASNLLAGSLLRLIAPLASAVTATGSRLGDFGRALRTRSQLAEENRRLRGELVELRRLELRQSKLELEADELAGALSYARDAAMPLHAAAVVYVDPGTWLRTMLLRVGASGARRDQVVLAEAGVVGRVVELSGPWAKVQLITDRAAAAGVYLEKGHRQGLLRGAGAERLELDYIPRQTEVEVGDRVLTAGIDGVYPRGLPVGVVTRVEPGDERFWDISVRPFVDFGELATVYLLDAATPPAGDGEGGANGRP